MHPQVYWPRNHTGVFTGLFLVFPLWGSMMATAVFARRFDTNYKTLYCQVCCSGASWGNRMVKRCHQVPSGCYCSPAAQQSLDKHTLRWGWLTTFVLNSCLHNQLLSRYRLSPLVVFCYSTQACCWHLRLNTVLFWFYWFRFCTLIAVLDESLLFLAWMDKKMFKAKRHV